MVRVQDLAKIALFEGLEQKTLELVTRIAVPRRYRKGEAILSEGEPGTGFHVAAAGRVKIFKLSPGG